MPKTRQPEIQALLDCWAQAHEEVKNKATGRADCAEVRIRTGEIFLERVARPLEYPEYGAHLSALARKRNTRLVKDEIYVVHKRETRRNREKLCEALTAIKDLDVPSMPKRLARQAIDQALEPVYSLTIKIPNPDYTGVWETTVGEMSFEEAARAAQYRGSLIENHDRPSMERFEFIARAGHILGAQARDKLRRFFAKGSKAA